ncbi:MAG TPA: arginine repressor [Longimicrobiales bacterium]|nr:arginine repressor [Longimicrobiales bacterium]
MGKPERHAAIRELIASHRVTSQEHLRELLAQRNVEVAQATLSRDIRELRLIKVPDAEGRSHYTLPPESWDQSPALTRLLPALYVGAEGTGNLLVVRTLSGGAQAVAEALDWEEWPEVLGTLAGDDTILLILRDPAQLALIQQRIEELAGAVD